MDIKQREHKKNIKVLDKAGLLGKKVRNSYIRSRDFVREQTEKDEEKPEDKLQKKSSDIAYKSVDTAYEAGKRRFIRSKQKSIKKKLKEDKKRLNKTQETRQTQQTQESQEKPENAIKTKENSGQNAIKTRDCNVPKTKDNIHNKARTIENNIKTKETIKNTQNATEQGRKLAERQYIRRTQMRYRLRNKTIVSRNIANSTSKTANAVNESAKQLATKPQFTKLPLQKSLSNHIFNDKRAIKTRKNSDIKIKKARNRLKIKKKATKTVKATGKTIKTSEQTAKVAVKTTGQTAKAVGKSSVTAMRTAKHTAFMVKQLGIKAAKATAAAAKAIVKATIAAVKATAASIKALMAAIAAGGWIAILIILVVVVLGGALVMIGDTENSYTPVSEEVNAYEPLIRIYAEEHGIPDYVELIKAVMMQESGGQGNDPMQASECGFNTKYPNTPNGITDPEYSIDVGIQNLAACLEQAKVESPIDMENIKLALQGYNFGNGYISWAVKNYGGYSYANAVEFSEMMAKKLGWSNYGDKEYVPHVLRYYPYGKGFGGIGNRFIVEVALSQVGNVGGQPYWSWYGFGSRVEWCACFVSWCANECGYLDAGVIPRFSACTSGEEWFKERGQWQGSNYEPKSGDIIFFDWQGDGKTDHVGIVDSVENGIIYTVEGNSSDACKQRNYPIGSKSIYGFGIPNY